MGFDALVLGAGVYGLSIATELINRGLKVAIVARDLPEDLTSTGFASPWAGCNWQSFEEAGTPEAEWDAITFKKLSVVARDHPDLCKLIPFVVVSDDPNEPLPWFSSLVPNCRKVDATPDAPLPGGFPTSIHFDSYILHAPNYLQHLAKGLRDRGVPIIRRRLASLDEAYDLPETGSVDLIVNALALGNRSLIGVEDDKMYPAGGQTVLVKAPLVNTCVMSVDKVFDPAPGKSGPAPISEMAYIIPRPGPEGTVILGGTYNRDNHSVLPDLGTAERILKDCYALEPLLAGPNGKSWRDIEIVSHNVGLRPARQGGVRLEVEQREVGGPAVGTYSHLSPRSRAPRRRKVAVVHAYGPGGKGYQSSIGLAEKAADLVIGQLARVPQASKL
ncbi:D-amino-acid oxidase [Vanrija pseudolonga]|uniref:D-amino-acid oxidase n=1 Tax=Vanrija pseudolonga TaxID=143232 RepID=A0AAF1BK15_9TREE|nr:D-amino-acid oxidase [Vanrija pseudolonga]